MLIRKHFPTEIGSIPLDSRIELTPCLTPKPGSITYGDVITN